MTRVIAAYHQAGLSPRTRGGTIENWLVVYWNAVYPAQAGGTGGDRQSDLGHRVYPRARGEKGFSDMRRSIFTSLSPGTGGNRMMAGSTLFSSGLSPRRPGNRSRLRAYSLGLQRHPMAYPRAHGENRAAARHLTLFGGLSSRTWGGLDRQTETLHPDRSIPDHAGGTKDGVST